MARVILSVLCGLLVPGLAGAQAATSAEVWRTPWGDPDLQEAWTNTTTTPFQRPFTDEERAELNARFTRGGERQANNATGAYNSFWLESGRQSAQETLITDPPDGRLPPPTERVRAKDAFFADARRGVTDPTTYAAPWRASIPMTALDGTLFEYACHEGNYGLLNILRGARARDGSR